MAYYFLYPEKDTTIYSHPYRTDLNTGKVETLALTTEVGNDNNNYYSSRFLIKFKDSEIKDVISNKVSNGFSSSLKLYATEYSNNLPNSQNIELYPLVDNWNNGTQRYINHPYFSGVVSDGASYLYKDNGTTKTSWSDISTGTTASYTGSTLAGGTWYTGNGFESTQSIAIVDNFDLNFDVTEQLKKFSSSLFASQTYPNGITNNGFIIKRENDVDLTTDKSTIKYFSVDTHTIFSPTLVIKWKDSLWNPPRSSYNNVLSSGPIQLNIINLKKEYKQNEESTIKVHARPQYPTREFTTSSLYTKTYYLNSTTYYSIEDYTSKEVIIPFDTTFTRLSADSEGMYFKLYMQGLQPERHYRLLIKTENSDGITVYDDNYYFKVVR